jgi:RNA polymerase sigma-70 factor (ECF subfamily)
MTSSPLNLMGQPIDWPQFLETHHQWLRTIVRARIRDEAAVDDVMQDVAVLEQESRPTDPQKSFPWLYRIAVRQVVNHRRRGGRRRNREQRWAANQTTAGPENPRDWVLEREAEDAVNVALGQMDARDRELLMLKYTQGWTYRQLADRLGATVKTIEYRLLRARRELRARLRPLEEETDP